MGIKVPPLPPPPGNDCLWCYDPGETPSELWAVFSDIGTGETWNPLLPCPPNRAFRLFQSDIYPCMWEYDSTLWHVRYNAEMNHAPFDRSRLIIWDQFMLTAFGDTYAPGCQFTFSNANNLPIGVNYWGGAGWVFHLI